MVKPVFRSKTLSTKVTEEEYAQLQGRAGDRTLSEWMRDVLLGQAEAGPVASQPATAAPPTAGPSAADEVVLAEVLALRTILLNLFYALSRGEPITEERMRQTIERADADKLRKAIERLGARGKP